MLTSAIIRVVLFLVAISKEWSDSFDHGGFDTVCKKSSAVSGDKANEDSGVCGVRWYLLLGSLRFSIFADKE